MRAVIFAGGSYGDRDFYKKQLRADDFFIAADAGCAAAEKMNIRVNVAIGDFDTLDREKISADEIISLNREKDYTDSAEAVELAIERGYDEILLFGGTGSRLDHTLCNIQLLALAHRQGAAMSLVDEHNIVYITDSSITLKKKAGWHLSVVQLTDAYGINLSGLYYPLHDKTLLLGDMVGISNEFTEDEATVSVGDGIVLVMLTRD